MTKVRWGPVTPSHPALCADDGRKHLPPPLSEGSAGSAHTMWVHMRDPAATLSLFDGYSRLLCTARGHLIDSDLEHLEPHPGFEAISFFQVFHSPSGYKREPVELGQVSLLQDNRKRLIMRISVPSLEGSKALMDSLHRAIGDAKPPAGDAPEWGSGIYLQDGHLDLNALDGAVSGKPGSK